MSNELILEAKPEVVVYYPNPEDRPKILCLSLWYPLSMSRYFEEAMRYLGLDLKTCGIYTKGWIPDVVMCIDAGISWTYKPTDGIVVHVATDPHALNYDYQRTISDKFFNMQKVYSQPKDIYLPYAFSKRMYYSDDSVSKDVDAVLIGMPYEQRVQWVNELRNRGVSVIFENGPIFDEYRELANRASIGLNWSSLLDLNCRVFETMAMKLCPVINRVPDLGEFFIENEHYLGFDNLGEAVEKVLWAKEHKETAEIIASSAYKAVQPHTFDFRVAQILQECGF